MPVRRGPTAVDLPAGITGGRKFCGGCAVGETVVVWPFNAEKLLFIDVPTKEVAAVDLPAGIAGAGKFNGSCAVGDTVVAWPWSEKWGRVSQGRVA